MLRLGMIGNKFTVQYNTTLSRAVYLGEAEALRPQLGGRAVVRLVAGVGDALRHLHVARLQLVLQRVRAQSQQSTCHNKDTYSGAPTDLLTRP